MKSQQIALLEDMGEESGREEAADHYPFLPSNPDRRILTWCGRGRAQGLYGLSGKAARIFAQRWAMGYTANCEMFERDGHLSKTESEGIQ
jgi:hypothetical protein